MALTIDPQQTARLVMSLATALQWLGSDQPDEAIMTHHGIYQRPQLHSLLKISFAPAAFDRNPVFIFDLKGAFADGLSYSREEVRALIGIVQSAGATTGAYWNGEGTWTLSVPVTNLKAGPGVRGLIDRYLAGCKIHPLQTSLCGCADWRERFSLAVKPEGWA